MKRLDAKILLKIFRLSGFKQKESFKKRVTEKKASFDHWLREEDKKIIQDSNSFPPWGKFKNHIQAFNRMLVPLESVLYRMTSTIW